MARERRRFARHAFHQVAVAAYRIHVEIENLKARAVVIFAQPLAGDGHAHTVPRALPQRASCGFYSSREMRFRMPRRAAVNLPKPLDLLHRNRKIISHFALGIHPAHPGQVQRRIQQH